MTFVDQFDPDKVGTLPTPEKPRRNDAFSQFDPYPDEAVTGFGPPPEKGDSSTTGAFGRGVMHGALPAIGSIPAIGAGAEAGAALGALGGPWAPVTIPVGTIAGGLVGGLGGGYALSQAQHWALSKLPSSWVEKIGMDDRQQQLDEAAHPVASFLGGLAPYAVTMRPSVGAAKALPENATAMQRIMAHPATARVFGGAAMGGIELGQEAVSEGDIDWRKVAISTGFGVVFNHPTKIGESLTEMGAKPARRVLGRPEPTAAVVPPATTEPAAEPATATGTLNPIEEAERRLAELNASPNAAWNAPPPPVTAQDFRNEITERTRTGRPYELPVTVADAADLGVMGPGKTEETFRGSHEEDPQAKLASQDTKRQEQAVIGPEPPKPDVRAVARRMNPETFEKYDELQRLRAEFSHWIEERNNPPDHAIETAAAKRDQLQAELDAHVQERKGYQSGPEARRLRAQIREAQREHDALQERRTAFSEGRAEQTPELIQARQHLMEAEAGLRDLHPEVQAAYRRAADAAHVEAVPAEARAEFTPIVPSEEAPIAPAAEPAAKPAETPQPRFDLGEPAPGTTMPAPPPKVEAPPEPPKPRTIAEQLAYIAGDVKRALLRVGRPLEEAEAAGHLVARRYEARAAHFNGALGTPEELYRETGAEILGPGTRSQQPRTGPATPRPAKSPERMSLLEFADHLGGLQRTGDLAHTLDENFKVRGRSLFRQDGLTEDRFREAASEAGYLVNNTERTGEKASLKELHEAIKEEAKGNKRYRMGMERTKAIDEDQAAHARETGEQKELAPDDLSHLSEEDRDALELLQTKDVPRASFLPVHEGRPIMRFMQEANASSFIHETGHEWLEQLAADAEHPLAPDQLKQDAAAALKWAGVESRADLNTGWKGARGRAARKAHEKFANGFMEYLREGVAPSKELAGVFAKFKNWLETIYRTVQHIIRSVKPGEYKPINEDIRNVFDRMLSTEPERTVIAPEVEAAKSLADHHEIDAKETEPHEADAVMSRVDAESLRLYDDHPEEQRELEAAVAEKAAAEAAGHEPGAGSEPPGEDSAGASALREVQPGGDAAGAEPEGGGTGPANGPERPGVNETGAKGAGLRGTEQRPGGGAERESLPLVPSPAAEFEPGESRVLDKAGNIRVENLSDVNDIAKAIHDSADRNDDFRGVRGAMTKGQMMDLADSMGLEADKIDEAGLAKLLGGTENLAPRILAARKLVVDSSKVVVELSKRAAETGSDKDVAAAAVAMARHDMIQSALAGVTAEWGRAGSAFHSLMEGWEAATDVNQFLKDNTGRTLFQMQMMAKMTARLDTPAKVSKYLRDAQKRTFGRMILEYWINGLISGPATHTTYMVGNAILAAEKAGPETAAAALIGNLRKAMGREGETVRLGEVGAQFRGAFKGLPGAVEASMEAMRSGMTTLLPGEPARPLIPFSGDSSLAIAKNSANDQVRWADVGAQAFGMVRGLRDGLVAGAELIKAGGEPGAPLLGLAYSPLGSIPDIAVRGVPVLPLGSAVRLPGRFIAAIHSFFRAVNYSMEKSALAYRTASEEGHTGTAFDARTADIWQNPSEATMERARHQATELTLMGSGSEFVKALGKLTNTNIMGFPFLKFVDPFVHIAGNIIDQSIIQRTPVGLLAPEVRADIMGKNGTVAQDMAMARMLVGTALSVTFGGLAAQGLITGSGPTDPRAAARWREVYQPHSVRIGDLWYQVNHLGPMGMLLGIAADMYDVAHEAEEGDMLAAGAHLQHALTQNILDESFMRGPAELIRAIEEPGRYGEAYIKNFFSSFVPFSVGMAQMARAADPYSREARTVMDAIKNKVPGLSETLMPRRNLWGEEIPNPDAFIAKGVTAIWEKKVNTDPVNQAMLALGIKPAKLERNIRNVDLTDAQYDDFARIAGRMTKMRLDTIVRSPDYQTWPNHIKRDVISEVIRQSREAGRGMMMMKNPQIPKDAVVARIKKRTDEPKGIE